MKRKLLVVHGLGRYITKRELDDSNLHTGRLQAANFRVDAGDTLAATTLDLCDVYLSNESLTTSVARRTRQFLPTERWTKSKPYAAKLLLAWKVACHAAIKAYLDVTKEISVEWAIGWQFSDNDVRAVIQTDGHHFAIFLLNPFGVDGKLAYVLEQPTDLRRMLATAKHEVVHLRHINHDDAFASLHTLINTHVHDDGVVHDMQVAALGKVAQPRGIHLNKLFVPNGTQIRVARDATIVYAVVAAGTISAAYDCRTYPDATAFLRAVCHGKLRGVWSSVSIRRPDDIAWTPYLKMRTVGA